MSFPNPDPGSIFSDNYLVSILVLVDVFPEFIVDTQDETVMTMVSILVLVDVFPEFIENRPCNAIIFRFQSLF